MRILIAARNREIAIESGAIVEADGRFDMVLRSGDADVRPGLINAHDHLHRNHYGRLGRPPYNSSYTWARDIQANDREVIAEGRRIPRRNALLAGAWKNLFAGVTTVVHHDPWEADFDCGFPLRVARVPSADSIPMSRAIDSLSEHERFSFHLAEGVGAAIAEEVRLADRMGLLCPSLIAVHGVGMDADGVERFRASGAALTWCPSSNLFLFGRTASAPLLREGLDVLLGSDSLLSGSGDLLDELRCARNLAMLCDGRLKAAVGATAARRLGIVAPSLETGAAADLFLCKRPLLQARTEDVLMVMVGGKIRVAAPELLPLLQPALPPGKQMTFRGVTRWTSANDASDWPLFGPATSADHPAEP